MNNTKNNSSNNDISNSNNNVDDIVYINIYTPKYANIHIWSENICFDFGLDENSVKAFIQSF